MKNLLATMKAERRQRASLCLYVAGELPHSISARANLKTLCAEFGSTPPAVEIVDVLRNPVRAMKDGVIATPTLIRLSPSPRLTFLGTLADLTLVREALGLQAIDPL